MVFALKKAGFEVIGCASGMEAIERAREVRPDLVLCDILMPDMDGYDVLRSMRGIRNLSDLPFIFLTGKDSMRDVRAGMDSGADDYLPKSLSIAEVVRAISARIERREAVRAVEAMHQASAVPDLEQMCRLGLSRRESEVMRWVIEGKTNEEIGVILGISRATVRTHLQNIFPKLGVENRLAAAQAARRGLQISAHHPGSSASDAGNQNGAQPAPRP